MKTVNTNRFEREINTDYPRFSKNNNSNAFDGKVVYSPIKSLWISSMSIVGIVGGYYTASLETLLVFLVTTGITICFGHSLGMHRLFIHQSFQSSKLLEYVMVYLGVLVGLAGPIGMMFTHDIRDWAQRQKRSHAYFGHKASFFKDAFWQMHCDIVLKHPPEFQPEHVITNDRFYKLIEKTWMWQQLPIALLLYFIGGIEWIIWGVCLRVMVSVMGHWLIGHFAHNDGHRDWHIEGASVQGYNIKFCGLITMGECWHNNHHAYPGSALLGINSDQTDPGWWVLLLLEKSGLVWNIKRPEDLQVRIELIPYTEC